MSWVYHQELPIEKRRQTQLIIICFIKFAKYRKSLLELNSFSLLAPNIFYFVLQSLCLDYKSLRIRIFFSESFLYAIESSIMSYIKYVCNGAVRGEQRAVISE